MKSYTTTELKELLAEFYQGHPDKDANDNEFYGDMRIFQCEHIFEFIYWIETGEYEGEMDDSNTTEGLRTTRKRWADDWNRYREAEIKRIKETGFVPKYSKMP